MKYNLFSYCNHCQALFQSDETVKEIENQLFLIDTKQLGKQTKYEDLLKMKRLLKRNYFDFIDFKRKASICPVYTGR